MSNELITTIIVFCCGLVWGWFSVDLFKCLGWFFVYLFRGIYRYVSKPKTTRAESSVGETEPD